MLDFFINGREQVPAGNRDPDIAPHGVFPAAGDDRWLAIVAATDAEFKTLCEVLNAPSMAADARFQTMRRGSKTWRLERESADFTRKVERDELTAALRARGIAAGPTYTPPR